MLEGQRRATLSEIERLGRRTTSLLISKQVLHTLHDQIERWLGNQRMYSPQGRPTTLETTCLSRSALSLSQEDKKEPVLVKDLSIALSMVLSSPNAENGTASIQFNSILNRQSTFGF